MKTPRMANSVGNIDDDLITAAAESKKKMKPNWMKLGSLAACFVVLVALVGIGVWQNGLFNTTQPPVANGDNSTLQGADKTNPTNSGNNVSAGIPDAPIIWGDANSEVQVAGFCTWDGKMITLSLHDVLTDEKNKNHLIAIGVSFELDNEFVYNGKTISEYEAEVDNAELLIDRLGELLKIGDELKYGEALYKTGTPDGKKWAKQLYDETVERIGKDVLSIYIVDGEFLKDKLEADIAAYNAGTSSRNAWNEAIEAYYKFIANETAEKLNERNVNCEVRKGLIVYVTVDEFSALEIENAMFYSLALNEDEVGDLSKTQTEPL